MAPGFSRIQKEFRGNLPCGTKLTQPDADGKEACKRRAESSETFPKLGRSLLQSAKEGDMKLGWTIGLFAGLVIVLGGWKALVSEAQSQQAAPAAAQTGPKELSNQEI